MTLSNEASQLDTKIDHAIREAEARKRDFFERLNKAEIDRDENYNLYESATAEGDRLREQNAALNGELSEVRNTVERMSGYVNRALDAMSWSGPPGTKAE